MELIEDDPALNPLHQNLILKLVLEHVGKSSIATLKNCRLVNHSWNKAAVKVLENHGFAAKFDYHHMLQLDTCLQKVSRNPGLQELHGLRLSLNLHTDEVAAFTQLLALNPRLRVAFVNYCVDTGEPEQSVNQELFRLLEVVSSSLVAITVHYATGSQHFEEFTFDKYLSLTFPKLKSLEYEVYGVVEQANVEFDLTKHVIAILQRATNIKKLHLYIWEGRAERTATSIRTMVLSCANELEELGIKEQVEMPQFEIFKSLADIKFPKLRNIKLVDGLYRTNEWLNSYLINNCPALTDLEVEWSFAHEIHDDYDFPVLPKIKNLKLNLTYLATSRIYLEQVYKIFQKLLMRLPSLTSLKTDLGVLAMLGAYTAGVRDVILPQHFPNIETLYVKIMSSQKRMFTHVGLASRIYRDSFPSLRKVIIKPDESVLVAKAKTKVQDAARFLCHHPSLQIVVIHNYAQAWMDRVLRNQKLEGIKSLTLLAPEKPRRGPAGKINLLELVTKLPALEYLQFGGKISSSDDLQKARDLASYSQPIAE